MFSIVPSKVTEMEVYAPKHGEYHAVSGAMSIEWATYIRGSGFEPHYVHVRLMRKDPNDAGRHEVVKDYGIVNNTGKLQVQVPDLYGCNFFISVTACVETLGGVGPACLYPGQAPPDGMIFLRFFPDALTRFVRDQWDGRMKVRRQHGDDRHQIDFNYGDDPFEGQHALDRWVTPGDIIHLAFKAYTTRNKGRDYYQIELYMRDDARPFIFKELKEHRVRVPCISTDWSRNGSCTYQVEYKVPKPKKRSWWSDKNTYYLNVSYFSA